MQIPNIIIAIDGYSSTGKSSFAKLIAAELGFVYLDSGALYRGVTLFAIENDMIDDSNRIDEARLSAALKDLDIHFRSDSNGSRTWMGGRCIEKEIRTLRVSEKVSPISTLAFVREYVDGKLHLFGKKKGVVMDGRDIGTTVFPDAELKIFMTAEPAVRADRRAKELIAKGEDVRIEDVLKNLEERDYIDSHRAVSPLTQAADAIVLDNSRMTMEEQMVWVKDLVWKKFGEKEDNGKK